jgi:hypothetical protein
MSLQNFTTSFEFPATFSTRRLTFALSTLEVALSSMINLGSIIATIDEADHTIGIKQALYDLQNKVAKFEFENSYLVDTPYLVTSHAEFKTFRSEIYQKFYQFKTTVWDAYVVLQQQLFQLSYNKTTQLDATVTVVNAFNELSESDFQIRSQLAIDNLRAVEQYFNTIESSTLWTTLEEAVTLINQVQPKVSIGSKNSNNLMEKVNWLPIVEL